MTVLRIFSSNMAAMLHTLYFQVGVTQIGARARVSGRESCVPRFWWLLVLMLVVVVGRAAAASAVVGPTKSDLSVRRVSVLVPLAAHRCGVNEALVVLRYINPL